MQLCKVNAKRKYMIHIVTTQGGSDYLNNILIIHGKKIRKEFMNLGQKMSRADETKDRLD